MTVIPGALADHLTSQTITDADTVAALDGARRGRGRTLVIEPANTRVLHVISAYAEAILENRKLHTAAKVRAARLWIQRAGHSVPAPAVAEQAPAAVRDEPSDWWTIMDPATGEEIARVHGETWQDMTPRAEALPEVRAVIRRHKGFSRRRLLMSEVTPAERAEQAEAAAEQNAPVNAFEQGAAGLLAARVDLADTVICPTCRAAKGARCITRAGKPARETHGRRVEALEQAAGITQHRATAAREAEKRGGWVVALDRKAEDALLTAYAARIAARARTADDQVVNEAVEKFDRAARAVDAVEHAEQVEAAVETVADAEALYAAALVTEAEATEGTWRGDWIGEQPPGEALFDVEQDTEQGALFRP
ncbi:hypothetical protein ACIQWZ_12405 [Streptomyces sp. NPDC098077]|uniref:hypothetical protein n=1 Tax=Streptomyces sp. NPDC098077 TaxID=3366093 RepID=UPI0038216305